MSDARLNRHGSGFPLERLEERMNEEIDAWYENGFSVDSMQELLKSDPMKLALRIAAIRNAVTKHEQLRRRISGLDWTRDPEMSVAINLDLTRPDRLDSLAASIPQLMMDLAQKKVVDKEFKFVPWRPQRRTRPVLIPVPQNTVEDAMEAILEDMDSEKDLDSNEVLVVEEQSDDSVEIIETTKDEEQEITDSPETEEVVEEIENLNDVQTDNQEAKENEVQTVESPQNDTDVDSEVFQNLLRALGLEKEADMLSDNGDLSAVRKAIASNVGIEPRDMRLDRLLRLSLRLMMKGDEDDVTRFNLVQTLVELAEALSKWTRTRLESRHNGSNGLLLEDAAALGIALDRIPGPGTPIPLDSDEYDLPAPDDLDGLSNEVKVLSRRIKLVNAGGIR